MNPSPTVAIPAGTVTDADDYLRSDAAAEIRLSAFLHEQAFGSRATLVTAAPGALTLFGRPGDRFALAMPVKWGATVAAARRDDDIVELRSGSQAGTEIAVPLSGLDGPDGEDLPGWAARPLAVVSSLTAAGHPLGGMSLLVGTALPEGAGMQSHVGLTTVVATALAALFGAELSREQRSGLGDLPAQLASLSCPDGMAMLVDTGRMSAELVPFDLLGAGLRLMLIDLGGTVGAVPSAGAADLAPAAVEELRRGILDGMGPMFGRAGDLADEPVAAAMADAACGAGALGAGTLPGGCLMALVPVSRLSQVRSSVTATWPGSRGPKFLTAVSSRGGRALTP